MAVLQFPKPFEFAAPNGGTGWSQEAREAFAMMPVASLADYYLTELDINPRGHRAQQLADIVAERDYRLASLSLFGRGEAAPPELKRMKVLGMTT